MPALPRPIERMPAMLRPLPHYFFLTSSLLYNQLLRPHTDIHTRVRESDRQIDRVMELRFPSWTLLISVVVPLLFLVIVLTRKNERRKKKNVRLPPGPKELPIIGNLHNLIGTDLVPRRLRDLAMEHGPLMYLKFGKAANVVVSNAAVAKEILKTNDIAFAGRPKLYVINVLTYGGTDVAFAPYGEYWRQVRKICILELLSAKRVKSLRKVREEELSVLVQTLAEAAVTETPVDLKEMILALSNNITARAAFGEKCKHQETYLENMKVGLELSNGFNLSDLFPSLEFTATFTGLRWKVEKAHNNMDRILDAIIHEHVKKRENMKENNNIDTVEAEEDLIDILLDIQERGDLDITLTNTHVKAIITDMFAGGTETSSTTLEWALSELVKNPETLKKATSEVRSVCGESSPDEGTFSQLTYLSDVVKENFRLHPPLPLLLPRECREETLINGYVIPEKTRIIVNMWAIGRDPNQWKDPEKFQPERFADSPIDFKGTDFELIPFGSGRRICPGMSFGLANVGLTLATLLYHFDWKLPNGASGEELDMAELFGVSMGRKNPLTLIPVIHSRRTTTIENGSD